VLGKTVDGTLRRLVPALLPHWSPRAQ
jgi:hypothetical protein